MMVGVQNMRVMDILAEATNIIAEGEVLQLLNINDADISDDDYLRVIHYKTAKLFEAATRLGAVICQASTEDENAMAEYGMRLGTAFQLIDDVLDLSGNSEDIGKNLGDDIAEGKPTLPLLYAMRHGDAKQNQLIRHAIEQGGLEDFSAIIQAVEETGALDYVRNIAKQEAELACKAIQHLPSTPQHQALIQLAEFSVSRTF
jgi:octaprenyl-diphosphate synthase